MENSSDDCHDMVLVGTRAGKRKLKLPPVASGFNCFLFLPDSVMSELLVLRFTIPTIKLVLFLVYPHEEQRRHASDDE